MKARDFKTDKRHQNKGTKANLTGRRGIRSASDNILQERFAREYLIDVNATNAAIRAGYSERTASAIGSTLLKHPLVMRRIQHLMDMRAKRTDITADKVLGEIANLAFSNLQDFAAVHGVDLSTLSREEAAAIEQIKVEEFSGAGAKRHMSRRITLKLADKRASLELLGKNLKLFTDKFEHSGPGGGPIELQQVRDRLVADLMRSTSAPAEAPAVATKTDAAQSEQTSEWQKP